MEKLLEINPSLMEGQLKLCFLTIKGNDRECIKVELSMQYCRKIFSDSSETYETFLRLLTTEFERKVDVQNHELGWIRFRNRLLRFLQYYILSLTNIYCRSVPLSVNSFLDFWTSLNPSKRTVVVIYSDLMKSTGFKTVHSSY